MLKLGRGYWRWGKGAPWCRLVCGLLSPGYNLSWGKEYTLELGSWLHSAVFAARLLRASVIWILSHLNCMHWPPCTSLKLVFFLEFSLLALPELLFALVILERFQSNRPEKERSLSQNCFSLLICDMSSWPFSESINPGHHDTLISPNSKEKLTTEGPPPQSFPVLCNEVPARLCICLSYWSARLVPQSTWQQHPECITSPPDSVKQHTFKL